MTPDDAKRLAEIKGREKAATKGPWRACNGPHKHYCCTCGQVWSEKTDAPVAKVDGGEWGDTWPSIKSDNEGVPEAKMEMMVYGEVPREHQSANMEFIAAARTDLPWAAERLEATHATIDSLTSEVARLTEDVTNLQSANHEIHQLRACDVARLTTEVEGAIEAAELFSDLLHRLEGRGVVLTPNEDRSWKHATQRVEKIRNLRTGAKP